MTDKEKLEKLIVYLGRRMYAHNQMADIGSTGEVFDEKIENAKYEECRDTLNFIDSLQKEPKKCMYSKGNYTDEDRKVLCDGCEEECKYARKEENWIQELQERLDTLSKEDFEKVWAKYSRYGKEEPVSDNLEEASKEWLRPQLDKSYANYGEKKMMELTHFDGYAMLNAIEFGVKWQKKRLMKDAISTTIKQGCTDLGILIKGLDEDKFSFGDKVKVIIVKEE